MILYLYFDTNPLVAPRAAPQITIRIKDHPIQAIQKAHSIGDLVFQSRWRFHKIVFYPPNDEEFASDGHMEFQIRQLPLN